MKKVTLSLLVLISFMTAGCLEDILSSLCSKLASSNSVIAAFAVDDADDYNQQVAVLTYQRDGVTNLEVSDCDEGFSFPNGERRVTTGTGADSISFISILGDEGNNFFFENGVARPGAYQVTIRFYANCDAPTLLAAPNSTHTSIVYNPLVFEGAADIPEEFSEIQECAITGQSAIIPVPETI